MAWSLIPQALPVLPPSRVRLQIIRDISSRRKLLGMLLSQEVLLASGMTAGDAVTLHTGQGPDRGWLRLDLASDPVNSCTLVGLSATTNSTVKFLLPDDTVEATESCKAPIWEARPGSLFIRVPVKLKSALQTPMPVTVEAAGMVPLYGGAERAPQEDPAPPAAALAGQDAAPVLEVAASGELEPPPPAAAAPMPIGRGRTAEESPDRLKPEAMQLFSAGLGARAVADQLHLKLTLVGLWKEEFELSRRKAPVRRSAA